MAEQLGGVTAQLWCWQEEPVALDWLTAWAGDPAAHREYFTSFLSMLRGAFFTRYASGEECDVGLSDRSQQAAMIILEACSAASAASHATLMQDQVEGEAREAAIATYRAAESVIGHLMNQLYFGSGAHADNRESSMPKRAATRCFPPSSLLASLCMIDRIWCAKGIAAATDARLGFPLVERALVFLTGFFMIVRPTLVEGASSEAAPCTGLMLLVQLRRTRAPRHSAPASLVLARTRT